MEAQDFAQHQDAAAGLIADADDLMQAALHLHFAFGHARRLHQVARHRRQPGKLEFVDFGRHIGGAQVHLLGKFF